LASAADVLSSWAVSSFGLKFDACTGGLNQVNSFIRRSGFFGGQCSEMSGVNQCFNEKRKRYHWWVSKLIMLYHTYAIFNLPFFAWCNYFKKDSIAIMIYFFLLTHSIVVSVCLYSCS
jgi:Cytochrome C oxidase subunit II, periplasmic domain